MEKPSDLDKYRYWLRKELGCEIDPRYERYYEQVVVSMKADLERRELWKRLIDALPELADRYRLERGYDLLVPAAPLSIQTKPFESFLSKTFRKNVLLNDAWPSPPPSGWIKPENWFERINDILRCLTVVRYLDGVEYLSDGLTQACETDSVECRVDFEAKEEGYYAAHFYLIQDFEIPQMTWDTLKVRVQIELQVTTQLQESIRRLLHHHYERNRSISVQRPGKTWQWQYKSEEFAANYLGHILHYVEGMIMEIRDKQRRTRL